MIEIKDLLTRFTKILDSKELEKETIAWVLSDVVGVEIKKEKIEIRGNSLFLDIKPIYKNQILIKKEEIESRLSKETGYNFL